MVFIIWLWLDCEIYTVLGSEQKVFVVKRKLIFSVLYIQFSLTIYLFCANNDWLIFYRVFLLIKKKKKVNYDCWWFHRLDYLNSSIFPVKLKVFLGSKFIQIKSKYKFHLSCSCMLEIWILQILRLLINVKILIICMFWSLT